MSRSSYDDMPDSRMNNRYSGNRGKTGLIAIAGILIALLCILLFLLFTPSADNAGENAAEEADRAAVSPEIVIPEIYIPEPENTVASDEDIISADSDEEADRTVEDQIDQVAEEAYQKGISWTDYAWKDGDDLISLSDEFGITPNTIISVNSIANISAIKTGDILRIPSADGQIYELKTGDTLESLVRRFNPTISADELGRINMVTDETLGTLNAVFIPSPETEYIESAFPEFSMPIKGDISVLFGEFYNGRRIDGVVIASHSGEAVRASLSGFVVDTGISPVYGKFIAIMHESGYKTSYYALESVDVRTGDNVEKGSVIGSVGDSNTYFGKPSLLFVIEQSGIKINPENVLSI